LQVVGARPQFVKLAPVCRAIEAARSRGTAIDSLIVHTGQHYDPSMSDVFFSELGLPRADLDLGVGSGSHGQQTGRMIEKLESAFIDRRPDLVLTYGDTNSTLAATLAAAKLQIPLAHVEAGLRSFNRRMPEEANRIVADHLSELLFAPTPESMRNLANEGLGARASQVGDVMLDAIRVYAPIALSKSHVLGKLGLEKGCYLVATLHRAENTSAERLKPLLEALGRIGTKSRPIVLPMHPRTAKSIRDAGLALPEGGGLRPIEPQGYLDMICLVANSRIVLTDSGGLQKEAFFLGRPCVTLREETEWIETVSEAGNIVAGVRAAAIIDAVSRWEQTLSAGEPDFSGGIARAFGDGRTADRIVAQTLEFLGTRSNT
jgi:UDP-N-acetylglucosamine 2-epimerase